MPPPEGVFDGHSVLLVGYQDDPKQAGGGVFVFRNSNHLGRERYMTYAYAIAYMNDALWIEYKTKP
jgi:C1A family cysteine protease